MTVEQARTRLAVGLCVVLVNAVQAVQGDQDPVGWVLLGAGLALALDGVLALWRMRS